MNLLSELNQTYLAAHVAKEEAFWEHKMGLKAYVPGTFEKAELALRDFQSDSQWLPRVRAELKRGDLTPAQRQGLEGWQRFFEVNIIEKPEAKLLQARIIGMEGELERSRRAMKLGYVDPKSGARVDSDSMGLSLKIRTADEEGLRQAAHAGLKEIETHVLSHGFIELVRARNELGRMLGYEDYYDFKVSRNEGFSKKKLFQLLDELERDTRVAGQAAIERLKKEKGPTADRAWNYGYLSSGSLTKLIDPYFRFQSALGRWGRSFMNLGIRYNGAELRLDLLSRAGKYENGFMHGPFPGFVDLDHVSGQQGGEGGAYRPARINFTSLGTPGQIGSGYSELNTLFHEGGHAAHFSNIFMPAPCFSQEFAPTSVAFAETQSMFCDSLVGDADWRARYARDAAGKPMPVELIRQGVELKQKYLANTIRQMLVVPYVERAIYEMADAELTPEQILRKMREIESGILFLNESPRPTLSIPHLLSGESSAYYHGYVLAEMAVHQTRAFFLQRDGHLLDNPRIGPDLARAYWKPGNSRTFLDLVQDLTGEPFSARAIVHDVSLSVERALAEADAQIAREKQLPFPQTPIDLGARISLVHGDEVIATNHGGESFAEMDARFSAWLDRLESAGLSARSETRA